MDLGAIGLFLGLALFGGWIWMTIQEAERERRIRGEAAPADDTGGSSPSEWDGDDGGGDGGDGGD